MRLASPEIQGCVRQNSFYGRLWSIKISKNPPHPSRGTGTFIEGFVSVYHWTLF
jgi:hypothetical protein